MKNLLIASTSSLYNGEYLHYLMPDLTILFQNCTTILFIPFAQPGGLSCEDYTQKVSTAFTKINKKVVGLHEFKNQKVAIKNAEAIFTGGGNTFLLVKKLHDLDLIDVLKEVLENGTPYLGTSAGSNIAGVSMQTTNDMPIVYPLSFKTLGLIPINLNPHYLDADLQSTHMGETRETRIAEFHAFNATPVIGLREGSWLRVLGDEIVLKGTLTARLFRKNHVTVEINPETNLNFEQK